MPDTDSIVERFVRSADVVPEQGWQIVMWCIEHGGDEFSLNFMRSGNEPASSHEGLRAALVPFYRGTSRREHLTVLDGAKSRDLTDTWRCNADSVGILRPYFSNGLLAAPSYPTTGWFEDFTVYRHGEIMLGVVSHEEICVLRVTAPEYREFSELKIKSHETPV
jgi:hypothetical protein